MDPEGTRPFIIDDGIDPLKERGAKKRFFGRMPYGRTAGDIIFQTVGLRQAFLVLAEERFEPIGNHGLFILTEDNIAEILRMISILPGIFHFS